MKTIVWIVLSFRWIITIYFRVFFFFFFVPNFWFQIFTSVFNKTKINSLNIYWLLSNWVCNLEKLKQIFLYMNVYTNTYVCTYIKYLNRYGRRYRNRFLRNYIFFLANACTKVNSNSYSGLKQTIPEKYFCCL